MVNEVDEVNEADLILALKRLASQQEERIREQDATIRELRETISDLRAMIVNLEESIGAIRRKI